MEDDEAMVSFDVTSLPTIITKTDMLNLIIVNNNDYT